jgi:hypothetical protein
VKSLDVQFSVGKIEFTNEIESVRLGFERGEKLGFVFGRAEGELRIVGQNRH